MTTTTPTLADRLRAWAKGMYTLEAGTELLIRQGKAIYEGAPWIHDDGERAWLDLDALLDGCGAWSGGQQRIVHLAASLMAEERVNLAEEVTGLDREGLDLLLAAIAHAGGSHEHGGVQVGQDGQAHLVRHNALYPWPTDA